ncbi:30S ribosomal protein S20 [Bacillus cytotoxicus]|uniref:30S ribosomal protein S20 n=1 Tax=Bacillus cytotoxicus TaxID=580165 RepID=A0ACC6A4J2_9BACI|nr:30S ribosomal protein S20 [Bacillus cytotoxicus]HDX9577939.1 30S ribosomal protein S20 [Bacillus pseudomycoides]
MANIKSAIKRAKLSEERRAHNASIKSDMRTAVKTVDALVNNNDLETAKEAYKVASKKLDKAARKGLIHQNVASRQKSRLAKKVNA